MSKERRHPVMEVFGPTVQGEGHQIGTPTHFVRFGGCKFRCKWCDSMFAVDPASVKANATLMTDGEIVDALLALPGDPGWVTLSGGDPALQHLDFLMERLHKAGFEVAMETQGMMWKDWIRSVDVLCISPKGPSSGMTNDFEMLDKYVQERDDYWSQARHTFFKVPIFTWDDIEFLRTLTQRYGDSDIYASTGNFFAEGSEMLESLLAGENNVPQSQDELSKELLGQAKWITETLLYDKDLSRVKVVPQLHVLYWGNERGK